MKHEACREQNSNSWRRVWDWVSYPPPRIRFWDLLYPDLFPWGAIIALHDLEPSSSCLILYRTWLLITFAFFWGFENTNLEADFDALVFLYMVGILRDMYWKPCACASWSINALPRNHFSYVLRSCCSHRFRNVPGSSTISLASIVVERFRGVMVCDLALVTAVVWAGRWVCDSVCELSCVSDITISLTPSKSVSTPAWSRFVCFGFGCEHSELSVAHNWSTAPSRETEQSLNSCCTKLERELGVKAWRTSLTAAWMYFPFPLVQ